MKPARPPLYWRMGGRPDGGFTARRQAMWKEVRIKIALVPAHAEYHLRDVAGDFNLRTELILQLSFSIHLVPSGTADPM